MYPQFVILKLAFISIKIYCCVFVYAFVAGESKTNSPFCDNERQRNKQLILLVFISLSYYFAEWLRVDSNSKMYCYIYSSCLLSSMLDFNLGRNRLNCLQKRKI